MATFLINYAHLKHYHAQLECAHTAIATGGCDRATLWQFVHLDRSWRRKNQAILSAPRGAGYWLWKPYIILRTLEETGAADVIIYADSGTEFIANVQPVVELCRAEPSGIVHFYQEHLERDWTKRDALLLLDADRPDIVDTPQACGSLVLVRRTPFALEFVRKWLAAAEDPRILTDQPNCLGLPNYPEFREHRHDQSILSLLGKRYRLPRYVDPSQYGNPFRGDTCPFGQITIATRRSD